MRDFSKKNVWSGKSWECKNNFPDFLTMKKKERKRELKKKISKILGKKRKNFLDPDTLRKKNPNHFEWKIEKFASKTQIIVEIEEYVVFFYFFFNRKSFVLRICYRCALKLALPWAKAKDTRETRVASTKSAENSRFSDPPNFSERILEEKNLWKQKKITLGR